MLGKIIEAKRKSEILSGIQIDYNTVDTINPSKAIIDFYSGTKTTVKDNYISCLILNDNNDDKSTIIKYTKIFEPDCFFEGYSTKDIVESIMFYKEEANDNITIEAKAWKNYRINQKIYGG